MIEVRPSWLTFQPPVLSVDEGIALASLDWAVEARPLFFPKDVQDDVEYARLPNHQVLLRTDTQAPIGIVTSEYIPHNPKTLLSVLDSVMEEMDYELWGAGSFMSGSYVWAVALSSEPQIRTSIDPFYAGCMLVKTYSGQYAHSLYPVVYIPTVKALLKFTDAGYSLASKKDKKTHFVVDVRSVCSHLQEFFDTLAPILRSSTQIDVPLPRWEAWVKTMVPKTSAKKSTLKDRFQASPTAYNALLLTAEYLEYDLQARRRSVSDEVEAHLYSRWFKTGDRLQTKFFATFLRWIRQTKQ